MQHITIRSQVFQLFSTAYGAKYVSVIEVKKLLGVDLKGERKFVLGVGEIEIVSVNKVINC